MAKKDAKPGYFNSKPILRVISQMKKTVGLQDSCIQTIEVAIRYFEEKAIESGNIEAFIKLICHNYSISLGIRDFNYLKRFNSNLIYYKRII